jgi:hypothetical protein
MPSRDMSSAIVALLLLAGCGGPTGPLIEIPAPVGTIAYASSGPESGTRIPKSAFTGQRPGPIQITFNVKAFATGGYDVCATLFAPLDFPRTLGNACYSDAGAGRLDLVAGITQAVTLHFVDPPVECRPPQILTVASVAADLRFFGTQPRIKTSDATEAHVAWQIDCR